MRIEVGGVLERHLDRLLPVLGEVERVTLRLEQAAEDLEVLGKVVDEKDAGPTAHARRSLSSRAPVGLYALSVPPSLDRITS